MTKVIDSKERIAALDPKSSFCVTAPAGSGKTELLIQRFLTVLARVDHPEQVLAITFTRKAAAEMRERILQALASAQQTCPEDEHRALTWNLARQVLDVSQQREWQLTSMPSRLNIKTIDSWNAYLTRQMPILSSFGGAASPTDHGEPYYRQAVMALQERLRAGHWISEDLAAVLLHFDNNWQQLEELLLRMLARREHWLVHLGSGLAREQVENILEGSVRGLVQDHLKDLKSTLGTFVHELLELTNYGRGRLNKPLLERVPGTEPEDIPAWRELINAAVTKGGGWKKRITKTDGFPANDAEAKEQGARLLGLISELQEQPMLLEQFLLVRYLPELDKSAASWEILISLARLLPVVAAQLTVVFQEQGVVDHAQIAIAAKEALGPDDEITDLAQKLDYQLKHILVDEYQDTSSGQFELLRRLTRTWASDNQSNPENPNTLFVVGDGMQSIYGFRDADVSLFVRLREQGISDLQLNALRLRTNFRSDAGLVNWVSDSFAQAFPPADDLRMGAVTFSASSAFKDGLEMNPVSAIAVDKDLPAAREIEASAVIEVIEQGLANADCDSIAVLVRTRRHLLELIALLKQRGLQWQAQEIDSLASSPVIVDLLNLTRALHNRADDVAWLGLLRSRWCGLGLHELHGLLSTRGEASVWEVIRKAQTDSPQLLHLRQVLLRAELWRERLPLRRWIEDTWLKLGGPAVVSGPDALNDAMDFLDLLEALEQGAEVFTIDLLEREVEYLFSRSASADARLQLMTLHKSKGLEFDWVIIPGLDHRPASDQAELLMFDDFTLPDGREGLLLAADDRGDEEANVYKWLKEKRRRKREFEVTRLMYVGCTRAVKRLYLSACVGLGEEGEMKSPEARSLLSRVWPWFEAQAMRVEKNLFRQQQVTTPFCRVVHEGLGPVLEEIDENDNLPDEQNNLLAREIGNLVHLSLERLAQMPLAEQRSALQSWQSWWKSYLVARLHSTEAVEHGLKAVRNALESTLDDDTGRWILDPTHEQSFCEYAVSRLDGEGRLREMVVDRSFVDSNVRWVIDYKSSSPAEGQSLEDFYEQEKQQYRKQLPAYRDALQPLGPQPVRMALYFTSVAGFVECS